MIEPGTDVGIQPDPVHEVVKRLAQAEAEPVVIAAGRVVERQVVPREADLGLRPEADPVLLGVATDRAMRGRREPVPVPGLDAARFEELPDALERIDRLLLGLRRETV